MVSTLGQSRVWNQAKRRNYHEWTEGEISGTTYGLSDKGWVDSELFRGWLIDHFARHAVGTRPLLLLLDGHSSHYTPDMIWYAKEHDIIIFCLPPHTTHEYQPLHVAVFGPLKRNWQEACHNYVQRNPSKVVTKFQFSSLLSEAWNKTMVPTTLAAGFRKCGVYPFNPEAPRLSRTKKVTTKTTEKAEHPQPPVPSSAIPLATTVPYTSPPDISTPNATQFTAEEEACFELRFEGFDLYDPRYVAWLECNHPEAVPADRYSLVPASSHSQDEDDAPSILSHFSSVNPTLPLQFSAPSPTVSTTLSSNQLVTSTPSGAMPSPVATPGSTPSLAATPDLPRSTPSLVVSTPIRTDLPGPSGTTPSPVVSTPIRTDLPGPSGTTPSPVVSTPLSSNRMGPSGSTPSPVITPPGSSRSTSSSTQELTYISKYLVQYVPGTPKPKATAKRVSGVRVLTSSKCLAELEEKESKKKKVAEEKEKRKQDCAEKKRQKEEVKKADFTRTDTQQQCKCTKASKTR